jgi:hypothetical protein
LAGEGTREDFDWIPPMNEWADTPSLAGSGGSESAGRLHAALIALFVAAGAGFAYSRGQDINYDQLNYHYYIAYAFETGRALQNVAPSQVLHSFFNPIGYLAFYFMVRHLPPRAVGTILGAIQGINLWLVFCIALIVTRRFLRGPRRVAIAAALIISIASPMAISEVGTSMADILTSLLVLAGLALLMQAGSSEGHRISATAWIGVAGALTGAAVSLKLTNAPFAIGLAAASLSGWTAWRDRLAAFFATALGGIVGVAGCGGFWYLTMWRVFHNPVFPYFNNVFASPDYPADHAVSDDRFLPHGLLSAIAYPWRWMTLQTTTAEIAFRDIRFAILMALGVLALGIGFSRRGRQPVPTTGMTPAGRRLIVFFVVAMVLWLYEWSIQRYIVVLELLAGPAIVVLLQAVGIFRTSRTCAAAASVVAIVCAVTFRAPDWGHLGWRKTWYSVEVPPSAGEHPVYLLAGEPLSFVVPELKPGSFAIGFTAWENIPTWGKTIFLRRIHELLAEPQDNSVQSVSSGPPSDDFRRMIAQYGLKIEGTCQVTPGRPWPLTWCTVVHGSPASQ